MGQSNLRKLYNKHSSFLMRLILLFVFSLALLISTSSTQAITFTSGQFTTLSSPSATAWSSNSSTTAFTIPYTKGAFESSYAASQASADLSMTPSAKLEIPWGKTGIFSFTVNVTSDQTATQALAALRFDMDNYMSSGSAINGNDNDGFSDRAIYVDGKQIGATGADAKLTTGTHTASFQVINDSPLNTSHIAINNSSVLEFMNINASKTPVTVTVSNYHEALVNSDLNIHLGYDVANKTGTVIWSPLSDTTQDWTYDAYQDGADAWGYQKYIPGTDGLMSDALVFYGTGVDTVSPDAPTASINNDSSTSFTVNSLSSTDHGNVNKYYISAHGSTTNAYFRTPEKSLELTSGIASYRYVADTSASTVVKSTDATLTANQKVTYTAGPTYLHIAAVDNAGNVSATTTISLNTVASGVDGTCPWTIDRNGVLSFGAGTLDRDQTQTILKTYNSDIKTITTANASGKVVFPADSSYIFKDPTLDASKIDTSQITWLENTYWSGSNLTSVDLSNADTSKVTNMSAMFMGDTKLQTITGMSSFNTSAVTNMSWMFYMDNVLQSVDVSSFNTSNVTNMLKMFAWNFDLQALDVSGWNTSKVNNMNCLFQGTTSIKSLAVSNWDVSNATNIGWMFGNMPSLQSLDVSKWVTTKNTNLSRMFWNDTSLKTLDVSNWDTGNVTDMNYLFSQTNLTSVDISKWNTSKVTNMNDMFFTMPNLTSLDIGNLDTSSLISMDYMFANMSSLKTLNIKNMNTSKVTSMNNVFQNTPSLTSLTLGSAAKFNTTTATDKKWVNPTDLTKYYGTTSALLASPAAGTYIPYVGPTISSGSGVSLSATAGSDLSAVKVPSSTAFSYVPNYANAITVSASATPLVSTSNAAISKTYALNNAFGTTVLNGNLTTALVPTISNSAFNSASVAYLFNTAATINLNNLKYGYAGTYQTKITYTISDGH